MEAKFSPRVKDVISYSREEAIRLGHDYIGTEHLLLGLIREGDGKAIKTLVALDIDTVRLKKTIEESIRNTAQSSVNLINIPLTKQAEKVLKITYLEAKIFKTDIIGTEHLLLSILRDEDNLASQILLKSGIAYDIFKSAIENNISETKSEMSQDSDEEYYREERKPQEPQRKGDPKSKTPVLDNFGRDLTKSAEEGSLILL